MKLKNFLSHLLSKKEKRKEPALSRLFFDLTQPVRVATNKISRYVVPLHNFNLTQPVRVATFHRSSGNPLILFQSNATRAGCNSKLAQTKQ
jgi:hypothetical protein